MFMRNNRAHNGAAQPEKTASAANSAQRAQDRLSHNFDVPAYTDNRTFMPDLSNPEAINAERVERHNQHDIPASYEAHVPTGPRMGMADGPGESTAPLRPMGKRGGKK